MGKRGSIQRREKARAKRLLREKVERNRLAKRLERARQLIGAVPYSIKQFVLIVVAAVGLLSSVAGIHAYWMTRLTVTPSQPLDVDDPLSAVFVVSNTGLFPVHEVTFGCQTAKGAYVEGGTLSILTYQPNAAAPLKTLAPDEEIPLPVFSF